MEMQVLLLQLHLLSCLVKQLCVSDMKICTCHHLSQVCSSQTWISCSIVPKFPLPQDQLSRKRTAGARTGCPGGHLARGTAGPPM